MLVYPVILPAKSLVFESSNTFLTYTESLSGSEGGLFLDSEFEEWSSEEDSEDEEDAGEIDEDEIW